MRDRFRSTPLTRETFRSSRETESTAMIGRLGLKTVKAKMRIKITVRIRQSNMAMQMFRSNFVLGAAIVGLVWEAVCILGFRFRF